MEQAPLASLSITHVHYDPTDPLSFLSAWFALVPQALCVAYVTLIWASREVEVILMFAGQMGCEALNFILKRIIKEERPKQMFGKGYGMPSSHAQFMCYFAVYMSLFLIFRHTPLLQNARFETCLLVRVLAAVALCFVAGAIAASRVYLNYHTPRQVMAGCAAGITCALSWFLITTFLRTFGWIDWALELPLARIGRVRDLVVSEDLAEAGWQQWEARRTLKRRTHSNNASKKSE